MRWKYKMMTSGAGLLFLLWFLFFANPDRIFLKQSLSYMCPLIKYSMDYVEYGEGNQIWAGELMESVQGKLPIYGYSISYYGDGMLSEHYKEYVEVLLAESREEIFDEAQLEQNLGQQEGGNLKNQVEEDFVASEETDSVPEDESESDNELEYESESGNASEYENKYENASEYENEYENASEYASEYESDRLNESESVFYITDGATADKYYRYPQGLLLLPAKQKISEERYATYEAITQNFYTIDNSTYVETGELDGTKLVQQDLSLAKTDDEPQILIYHTHSTESYVDSIPGDSSTSIVGVGEALAQILNKEYGYQVLHHKGQYDTESRDYAYTNALPALEQLLKENPSIQVVIDLHRDAVSEDTNMVTEIEGVRVARFMFFNGLSRVDDVGEIRYLPNPYLQKNLAFSFQMQMAGETYYPGLARKIYLKGYRYNMHLKPRSLLIELGAQNNTFQEAVNACVPVARLLHEVLSGH